MALRNACTSQVSFFRKSDRKKITQTVQEGFKCAADSADNVLFPLTLCCDMTFIIRITYKASSARLTAELSINLIKGQSWCGEFAVVATVKNGLSDVTQPKSVASIKHWFPQGWKSLKFPHYWRTEALVRYESYCQYSRLRCCYSWQD